MFMSTKFILDGLNNAEAKRSFMAKSQLEAYEQIQQWFINFDNARIDKPTIIVNEIEKGVVLYCNDALWAIVQKWQNKELESLTMIDGIKIWKEIKTIMEKK